MKKNILKCIDCKLYFRIGKKYVCVSITKNKKTMTGICHNCTIKIITDYLDKKGGEKI